MAPDVLVDDTARATDDIAADGQAGEVVRSFDLLESNTRL
jgi:hypothetical protein